jgi:hypothetical protein
MQGAQTPANNSAFRFCTKASNLSAGSQNCRLAERGATLRPSSSRLANSSRIAPVESLERPSRSDYHLPGQRPSTKNSPQLNTAPARRYRSVEVCPRKQSLLPIHLDADNLAQHPFQMIVLDSKNRILMFLHNEHTEKTRNRPRPERKPVFRIRVRNGFDLCRWQEQNPSLPYGPKIF